MDPIPIAHIIDNDLEEELQQLEGDLIAEGLPEPVIEQIISNTESIDPAESLEAVLQSPELTDLIDLIETYDQEQAELALANEEISAVITIPEQFSYQTLSAFYLDEDTDKIGRAHV